MGAGIKMGWDGGRGGTWWGRRGGVWAGGDGRLWRWWGKAGGGTSGGGKGEGTEKEKVDLHNKFSDPINVCFKAQHLSIRQ